MSRLWKLAVVAMLPIAMAFAACEDEDNDVPDFNGNGFDDTMNDDGLDDTGLDDNGLGDDDGLGD